MNKICDNAKTLISKFGQDVKVQCTSEKTIKTKAFIQPLRSDYQSPLYGDYLEETNRAIFIHRPTECEIKQLCFHSGDNSRP